MNKTDAQDDLNCPLRFALLAKVRTGAEIQVVCTAANTLCTLPWYRLVHLKV